MRRRHLRSLLAATTAALTALALASPTGAAPGDNVSSQYAVSGIRTAEQRSQVARSGAAIDEQEEHGTLIVTATGADVRKLRNQGFTVEEVPKRTQEGAAVGPFDFPPADANYHNYAEMTAEINQAVADHPNLLSRQVIGKTYENRDIVALKISDNVATDENEPEVLFTAHQHAREHLTVEMALYLIQQFTDNYTEPRIKELVDTREIWIVPDVNPDGGEYDIATGSYPAATPAVRPTAGRGPSPHPR
jgi:carboxypeptidase T